MGSKKTLYIGQGLGSIFYNITMGGVLTLLAMKIGAREFLIGLLAAIPPLVGVIFLLFLHRFETRYQRTFFFSDRFSAIFSFAILPFLLVATRIPFTLQITCLILFHFILHTFYNLYTLSWFPMMVDLVPEKERGDYFGRLRFIILVVTFIAMKISSEILGDKPGFLAFFWVFLILCIVQATRPIILLPLSRVSNLAERTEQPRRKIKPMAVLWSIFSKRESRLSTCYFMSLSFIGMLIGPFLIPFLMSVLGMSAAFCIFLSSMNVAGYGLTVMMWGRLNDLKGSRYVLFSSLLLAPLYWMTFCRITTIPAPHLPHVLTGLYFISGIVSAGQDMAKTTRRMTLAPAGTKFSWLGYAWTVDTQVPALIAAPLGGFILQKNSHLLVGSLGIYQILFLGAAVIHLLLLLVILAMKPLKERPLGEIMKETVSGGLLKFRDFVVSPP